MNKELIADPVSIAAIKYRNSDKRRERNEAFLVIQKRYRNKALSIAKRYRLFGADFDNLMSIYNDQILYALSKWTGKSNFSTYLHSYMISLTRIYMKERMHFKSDIQCLMEADVLLGSETCCLGDLPNNDVCWDVMGSAFIMDEAELIPETNCSEGDNYGEDFTT